MIVMLSDEELDKLITFAKNSYIYCGDNQYVRNVYSALTELRAAREVVQKAEWVEAYRGHQNFENALNDLAVALDKYGEAIK